MQVLDGKQISGTPFHTFSPSRPWDKTAIKNSSGPPKSWMLLLPGALVAMTSTLLKLYALSWNLHVRIHL